MTAPAARGFSHRALEIHSSRMWQWAQVEQALAFMSKFGLNALVFHQNDIVDQLVFPEKFFPPEWLWKRNPVRLHTVHQNRHYINKVAREAKRAGIAFHVEIKEIWFVEQLLEGVPQVPRLRNASNGAVCPTHPFWWELLEVKMRELTQVVPDLAGVIVSPGTRESKVSIAANACGCARCQATDPTAWYTSLLSAMHRPLSAASKTFAVRDFSYSADTQSRMLDAARATSPDIVISLKNTPHDYYPTFPDNPRIGHTGGMRQWIEYDTWGQFFGLGFFPVSVVEDMQRRMRHAFDSGAEGIALRTDWEVITDSGAFNSPNVLNVVAGAMLAQDVDCDVDAIYDAWARHGFYSPMHPASAVQPPVVPAGRDAATRLKAFMRASWSVMERSAYVRGHLFHEDDQYPRSVANAFDMLVEIHGRDDWEPGASKLLDPTVDNLAAIRAEKAAASADVKRLADILQPHRLGVGPEIADQLSDMLELYVLWVEGFELCASAVFAVSRARARTAASPDAAALDAARATVTPLRDFGARVAARLEGTSYPHYVYWLLDTTRTDDLADDVEAQVEKLLPPDAAGSPRGGP